MIGKGGIKRNAEELTKIYEKLDALHKIPNLDPKTKNIIAYLLLKKMYYTSCLNEQISKLAYEERLLRKGKKFLTQDELKLVEGLRTSLKKFATEMKNIGGDSVLYLIEKAFKKSPKQLLTELSSVVPIREQLFKVLQSIGTIGKNGFKFSIKNGEKTLNITSDILFGVSSNSHKLLNNAYRDGKLILSDADARKTAAFMPIIGTATLATLLTGGLIISGLMQTSAINDLNKQYGTYLNIWSNSKNYPALTLGTIVDNTADTFNLTSWLTQLPAAVVGGLHVSKDEAEIINTDPFSNQYRMLKIQQWFSSYNSWNLLSSNSTHTTTAMIRGISEVSHRQISRLNETNAELQTLQQLFSSVITKKQSGETITENDIIKLSVIINKISDFASDMCKVFNNDYSSFIKKILAILPKNFNYGKDVLIPNLIEPIILYMVECIKTNINNKYTNIYRHIAEEQIDKIKQIINSNDKYTGQLQKNITKYITNATIPQSFENVLNDFKNIKNTLNDSKKIYFNFIILFLLTYVIMPYNSVDEALSRAKLNAESVLLSFIATARIYDGNNGNTNKLALADENYLKLLKEFQKINNVLNKLSNNGASLSFLDTKISGIYDNYKDKGKDTKEVNIMYTKLFLRILPIIKSLHILIFLIFNEFFISMVLILKNITQFLLLKNISPTLFNQAVNNLAVASNNSSKITLPGYHSHSANLFSNIFNNNVTDSRSDEAVAANIFAESFLTDHEELLKKRPQLVYQYLTTEFEYTYPYDINGIIDELNSTNEHFTNDKILYYTELKTTSKDTSLYSTLISCFYNMSTKNTSNFKELIINGELKNNLEINITSENRNNIKSDVQKLFNNKYGNAIDNLVYNKNNGLYKGCIGGLSTINTLFTNMNNILSNISTISGNLIVPEDALKYLKEQINALNLAKQFSDSVSKYSAPAELDKLNMTDAFTSIKVHTPSLTYNFKYNDSGFHIIKANVSLYELSGILITLNNKKYRILTQFKLNEPVIKLSNIYTKYANAPDQIKNIYDQIDDILLSKPKRTDTLPFNYKTDEVEKVSLNKFTLTYEGCSFKIPDISMLLKLKYLFVSPLITIKLLTQLETAQLGTSNIVTATAVRDINSLHLQIINDTTAQLTQVLSLLKIKADGESLVPQSDVLSTLLNKSTAKSSFPPTPRAVIAYVPRERFVGLEVFLLDNLV